MEKRQKTCYLVCAGESVPLRFAPRAEDFVIAVDGGAQYLEKSGIKPDLFLGDFDSLGYVPKAENVVRLNAEKDETDTLAAINEGLERGYRNFEIYCALGGRLSHALANVNTLLYAARRGADAKIIGERTELFVIRKSARFERGGYLSLLPLGGNADVLIHCCKYGGSVHLSSDESLGVSNEPLDGASVEVIAGEVLAVVENV